MTKFPKAWCEDHPGALRSQGQLCIGSSGVSSQRSSHPTEDMSFHWSQLQKQAPILCHPSSTHQTSLSFYTYTRNLPQSPQMSMKPGAPQLRFILLDCSSAEYARTSLALVAWMSSGWLLAHEVSSATTLYVAAIGKALVTEVAQQLAVSIPERQVLSSSCQFMDLEA